MSNRFDNDFLMFENHRRTIATLNDVVYYYNRNMSDYQANVSSIIELLDSIHYRTEPNRPVRVPAPVPAPVRVPNVPNVPNLTVPRANTPRTNQSNRRNAQQTQTHVQASVPASVPAQSARPPRQTVGQETADIILSYFFNPLVGQTGTAVPVLLTAEQINNSTRIITYTDDMDADRCAITLEDFRTGETVCQIRHCGHIFKNAGLMNWFERHTQCPVCRYDLRHYRDDLRQTPSTTSTEFPRFPREAVTIVAGNLHAGSDVSGQSHSVDPSSNDVTGTGTVTDSSNNQIPSLPLRNSVNFLATEAALSSPEISQSNTSRRSPNRTSTPRLDILSEVAESIESSIQNGLNSFVNQALPVHNNLLSQNDYRTFTESLGSLFNNLNLSSRLGQANDSSGNQPGEFVFEFPIYFDSSNNPSFTNNEIDIPEVD
jgi:hypothetical protein